MYLDVDVIYSLLKENDFNRGYAEKVLQAKGKKYTSVVSLLELEIVVKRELGDALSLETSQLARKAVPELQVLELSQRDFEKSLELRKRHGLGIFDALHAAVCIENDGIMASTDQAFERVKNLKRFT